MPQLNYNAFQHLQPYMTPPPSSPVVSVLLPPIQPPKDQVYSSPNAYRAMNAHMPRVTPVISPRGRTTSGSRSDWRNDRDIRRLRSRMVVLIESMLRNHQPHDVLTQVHENANWRSRMFVLAQKMERLAFVMAKSKENYLNEHTLRSRVQVLARHLVRMRRRRNVMDASMVPSTGTTLPAVRV